MNTLEGYNVSFYRWEYQREEQFLEESLEVADIDVEGTGWSPLKGKEPESLRVIFVDGIRGLHQAVYLESEKERGEGFFVTLCAGALELSKKGEEIKSKFLFSMRERLFITNVSLEGSISVGLSHWNITFKSFNAKEDPVNFINKELGNLEYGAVERSAEFSPDVIFWDGTLKYNLKDKKLPVAGFVKRHMKYFLPEEESWILKSMKVGERTPIIFLLDKKEEFNRYTWYVKIEEGGLAGTLRFEVPEEINLERAKFIADCSAWLFPKIVSAPFTDKRSPHNVVPIRYLEAFLRKEMGDPNLIKRAIEVKLSQLQG